jgi:hypothetical protein
VPFFKANKQFYACIARKLQLRQPTQKQQEQLKISSYTLLAIYQAAALEQFPINEKLG